MGEWIRWTDVSLLLVVSLAFAIAFRHCVHAQKRMKRILPTGTKRDSSNVEGLPDKLA